MKRVMAVDYGDRRTGVAFSDISRTLTGEAFTITVDSLEDCAAKLLSLASERDACPAVIGLPRNMDGTYGPRAEKSRQLAQLLNAGGLETLFVDERRTTVDAHRILDEAGRHGKKRKERIDAVAASLILETYLEASHE